jgi:2-keto-4-pentenoate hydratase
MDKIKRYINHLTERELKIILEKLLKKEETIDDILEYTDYD